jgi:photosystem II stability/assembly factor-like uncharacterized protein
MRYTTCLLLLLSAAQPRTAAAAPATFDSGVISGLGIRNIGSATMSGRIAAVAAHAGQDGKVTVFVGSASGGVWRSLDSGTTFRPVFDKQAVQSIGAIAIDPSDTKTVWVGTGESWTRNSVSIGDGVYKSVDGGDTWTHAGLPESERIAAIAIDPSNGQTVYACAPGKLWSDSPDRGLYKTSDGGRTWSLVLKGSNPSTGCASVSIDPKTPGRLLASLWDFRRQGWTFRSGGESPAAASGSGLYVSNDAGATWSSLEASTAKGLPAKPWGRVAVAIAPSDPSRVYATIECSRSALFVSDDGGKTFEERDRSQMMVWRPFYFANLIVDPKDKERVFKAGGGLIVSNDGGRSFSGATGGSHGDWHDVWINPQNTRHLVGGDDGGLWISYDGASRWWKADNLPISQFYHVSTDGNDPYQVYGGLQDNSSWVGDSAYPGGITSSRWENLYNGDGFWAFADPSDPDFAYAEMQGGAIGRVNRHTLEARDIQPKAGKGEKLRFNWNTPIHLSPNEKGTIYIGAQFVFRSRDHGQTWDRISPDLTTNDPARQQQEKSGGVTVDNSAAEMHTTIYSISESPKNGRRIWVGTDDGKVQLTRDGGSTWTDAGENLPGVPAGSWISWVEASQHDEKRAYVAVDRHTMGDMTPYIFRTDDDGVTWQRIAGPDQGLRGYVHVIREDVVSPDLLFAGTEFGLWVSIDHGARWAQFKPGNFPAVAVRDLVVQPRDHDLVLATHGRGIWIVDDITPLRQLTADVLASEATFLPTRPVQQRIQGSGGWSGGDASFTGANAESGAVITYYQRTRHLFGRISLQVLDSTGAVVDTIPASARRGINRVAWSMRVKPPEVPPAAQLAQAGFNGPRVLPGVYTVRLTKGDKTYETTLAVGLDRRATFNEADRKAQYDAAMRVHALFGSMTALVHRINSVRDAADRALASFRTADPARRPVEALSSKVDEVRKRVVATTEGGAITGEERLREHADQLYAAILSYEGHPADYQVQRIDVLREELADIDAAFQAVLKTELRAANAALKKKHRPQIAAP